MGFYAYENISDEVLDKKYTTSTGEQYTLRHNENLKVEMSYLGKGHSKANSQGWERDKTKYFNELYQNHPEMFSKKNAMRIQNGETPIVDQKMISCNPGWSQYKNQPLVHHHIGGDGEAVALPKNAHKGHGEIHNAEKEVGITGKCQEFSQRCSQNTEAIGKKASQLHGSEGASRSATVRNASSTKDAGDAKARSASVESSGVKSTGSASGRGEAVRSVSATNGNSAGSSQGKGQSSGQGQSGGQGK